MIKTKTVFWATVAIALSLYITMLAWSLPILTKAADGLVAFDLRPGGYSFAEAKHYLETLSDDGNFFYRGVQHKLDTFFPAFEGIAVGWAVFLLAPAGWKNGRFVLLLPALAGTVFDYLENASVAVMLKAGATGLTQKMVTTASMFSQLKALFVTIAMVLLVALIVRWFWKRRKHQTTGSS
jgi:hypothetical protein